MTLAIDLATNTQALGQQIISNLSPWYENGVFYQQVMNNWPRMGLAPAALMATLVKYMTPGTNLYTTYLRVINEIVARVLETNATTDGLILDGIAATGPFTDNYFQGPDRQSMGTAFGSIAAIEGIANLAWILIHLPAGAISDATRANWLNICKLNVDYLDTVTHDTTYYTNGNINAQMLGTIWFTAQACTSQTDILHFQDMYEREIKFLVDPFGQVGGGWSGWGLHISTSGAEYDWSDYLVYLTETSTRNMADPDFDWNYSHTQMDALARIYVMNRDTRLIRLINGISNKVFSRVDIVNGYIDGTGGSRQNNHAPLTMGVYPIQALIGNKSSNRTLLSDANITTIFNFSKADFLATSTAGQYQSGFMHGLSLQIAATREAAAQAQFKVPAV